MTRASEYASIRLTPEHMQACKKLPPHITISVLVRVLLSAYFKNRLPAWLINEVIAEGNRTQQARKMGGFKPGHIPWNQGDSKCQTKATAALKYSRSQLNPPSQAMTEEL